MIGPIIGQIQDNEPNSTWWFISFKLMGQIEADAMKYAK